MKEETLVGLSPDFLREIYECVQNGIEYTQVCRSEHERSLGRTTSKNRNLDDAMEKDVVQMNNVLNRLQEIGL